MEGPLRDHLPGKAGWPLLRRPRLDGPPRSVVTPHSLLAYVFDAVTKVFKILGQAHHLSCAIHNFQKIFIIIYIFFKKHLVYG